MKLLRVFAVTCLVSGFVLTGVQPAQAYTAGCRTHSKSWTVRYYDTPAYGWVTTRVKVCWNKYGRFTTASSSDSEDSVSSVGHLLGYKVVQKNPYQYYYSTSSQEWRANGYAQSCLLKYTFLCDPPRRWQITMRVRSPRQAGATTSRLYTYGGWSSRCTSSCSTWLVPQ